MKYSINNFIMCCLLGLTVAGFSGFSDPRLEEVQTAVLQKDFAATQKLAERWLNQPNVSVDDNNELRYYLGLSFLYLDQPLAAGEVFWGLTQREITPVLRDKVYLGLFNAYYLEGKYQAALKTINALLSQNPDSALLSVIHLKIARAQLKLANWRKAEKHLKLIVADFPDSFEAHSARQLLEEKRYFTVQVGAFVNKAKAESLLRELQNKGEYAYIIESKDTQDRMFYKVRVGRHGKLASAERLQMKLSDQGYPALVYP